MGNSSIGAKKAWLTRRRKQAAEDGILLDGEPERVSFDDIIAAQVQVDRFNWMLYGLGMLFGASVACVLFSYGVKFIDADMMLTMLLLITVAFLVSSGAAYRWGLRR